MLAKAPVPGRVKTRLCPPCTPEEAAAVAAACLADTLAAATGSGADRVVLVLDGDPGPWVPPGVLVRPQAAGSLDQRLEAAWAEVTGPALQIGMDTPQVGPAELDGLLATVARPDLDAVLAPAEDGGWWAVGFRRPVAGAFAGVPMSTDATGARQRERLEALGLRVATGPTRRDLDHWPDALALAEALPDGTLAAVVRGLVDRWTGAPA